MLRYNIINKRGVSAVIEAIMLIIIVIVLFFIVFVWSKNIVRDRVVTIEGENADYVCDRVVFRADYDNSDEPNENIFLILSNEGNINIKNFLVKKITRGEEENFVLGKGLASGKSDLINIYNNLSRNYEAPEYDDFTSLKIIPILEGATDSGKIDYICKDSSAQEVLLS